MHLALLERTRELIDSCPCASGCPSCVGPEGNTGPHAKQVASRILQHLLGVLAAEHERWILPIVFDRSFGRRRRLRQAPRRRGASSPTSRTTAVDYEAQLDLDRVADRAGRPACSPTASAAAWPSIGATRRTAGTATSRSATASSPTSRRSSSLDGGLEGALPFERRAVFIDLETTGLSGGAGTVAFLVGCGYFDLGAFQVRQFLLTSYSAERALLAAAAELFGEADLIVTYNGKTFDVPMMETRWAFHRMRAPLDDMPHFDMLHPARRLWRTRSVLPDDGGLPIDDAGTGAAEPAAGGRRRRFRDTRPVLPLPENRAIRVRSSRCSSTTGSISSRSPR